MNGLTHEEIERMRQIVRSADASRTPMETVDPNKPEVPAYRFQKFPMMVYGHGGRTHLVRNENERLEAVDNGWSEDPPAALEADTVQPLSAAYQAEASRIDKSLEEGRRRKPSAA